MMSEPSRTYLARIKNALLKFNKYCENNMMEDKKKTHSRDWVALSQLISDMGGSTDWIAKTSVFNVVKRDGNESDLKSDSNERGERKPYPPKKKQNIQKRRSVNIRSHHQHQDIDYHRISHPMELHKHTLENITFEENDNVPIHMMTHPDVSMSLELIRRAHPLEPFSTPTTTLSHLPSEFVEVHTWENS